MLQRSPGRAPLELVHAERVQAKYWNAYTMSSYKYMSIQRSQSKRFSRQHEVVEGAGVPEGSKDQQSPKDQKPGNGEPRQLMKTRSKKKQRNNSKTSAAK